MNNNNNDDEQSIAISNILNNDVIKDVTYRATYALIALHPPTLIEDASDFSLHWLRWFSKLVQPNNQWWASPAVAGGYATGDDAADVVMCLCAALCAKDNSPVLDNIGPPILTMFLAHRSIRMLTASAKDKILHNLPTPEEMEVLANADRLLVSEFEAAKGRIPQTWLGGGQ